MSRQTATLFDDDVSPRGEEALLLDDLLTLEALGLLEARPSPDGPVYGLTNLGRETPEFGGA